MTTGQCFLALSLFAKFVNFSTSYFVPSFDAIFIFLPRIEEYNKKNTEFRVKFKAESPETNCKIKSINTSNKWTTMSYS